MIYKGSHVDIASQNVARAFIYPSCKGLYLKQHIIRKRHFFVICHVL